MVADDLKPPNSVVMARALDKYKKNIFTAEITGSLGIHKFKTVVEQR